MLGRLIFFTFGISILGLWPAHAFSQDANPSAIPERELAKRVIRQDGQVEIKTGAMKTQRVQKISDLPEDSFSFTRLDFGGQSRVTDADLKNLGPLTELLELNLSYTRITDEGFKSLEQLPALRQLYLADTPITDAALEQISRFESLVSLDLSGTKITDKNLEELKKLPNLSRLFLARTNITGEAIPILAGLSRLSVLHLSGPELSAEDVAALSQLPELAELSLTTGKEGLAKLAELPALKILTVHGPAIADEGMPALSKLTNLEQLRLSQTGISDQGVKRLKDSLTSCRIMAHPVSRQSAFLMSSGLVKRPVLRWQPGEGTTGWNGLITRPAKLPGLARWQVETREPRSEIRAVDFSPNGQQIACGTAAGQIRIYNADTLALEKLIPAHPQGVFSVAWSPDGTRIASAGLDQVVRIWNSDGREQHQFQGHRAAVTAVAWSPDGQWLASGGWDTTVRIWKADGSGSKELKGHTKAIASLAWSPESTQVASGSSDATIRVWDLTGKEVHVLKGHTDSVVALAWSSRGSRLASGSWDHTIRFWNPRTGRGGPVLEGHTYRIFALEWHPQGSLLASSGDRTLRLWTMDGTPVRTLKTEDDYIFSLSWKHDGNEIATGTRGDSILRVVNTSNDSDRSTGGSFPGGVADLAWHPSGDRIAAGCRDRKIRLVTEDGRAGALLNGPTYIVRALEWSPDGERLASGGDAALRLWNRQGIPLKTLKEHQQGIQAVDWSPDGKSLASVSDDGTARIWSADGEVEQVINLKARARRVAWRPDNQQLAAASDNQVQIWNRDGSPGPELPDAPKSLVAMAWNKTTDQIAAGGWSRTLQVWNGEGEKGPATPQVQAILDIAVHPQGNKVALALFSNTAVIADADGSNGRTWNAHAGPLNAVAWHPDGHTLATGAYDNTLRFWEAETIHPERTVLLFGDGNSAAFTAAGQLEQGDVLGLEDHLVYLIETEQGEIKLLSPAEFEQRFHDAGDRLQQGG